VEGNRAFWGGGVYVSNAGVELKDCAVIDNIALGGGGGVCSFLIGEIHVSGGKITGNRTDLGGGIYLGRYASLDLSGTELSGNRANRGAFAYTERGSRLAMGDAGSPDGIYEED
jgi:hypothetical protein